MDKLTTDTLLKPDMLAVLSRTHLQVNLHGFLLPIFEAISNAMHGIEEAFDDSASAEKIGLVKVTFKDWTDPHKIVVSVSDNGAGLHDDNYRSFKTPFSGAKLSQKGRGFGRFIAFKVFARVVYHSRFAFFGSTDVRAFRFDVNQEQELILLQDQPVFEGTGLAVTYDQPLLGWHDLIRALKADDITDEIGAHFLPYFLYRWLPQIIQFDEGEPIDIRSRFQGMFKKFAEGTITCDIDGAPEELSYSLAKLPRTQQFKSHCLLLSAADRIVGTPRDLSNKIGQPFFFDENGERYVVIAVVRGEAFESRLNDSRTGINLGPRTVEDVVSHISDVIQREEHAQIDKIKSDQSVELAEALRENPILKLGLRGKTVSDYVKAKPNNWKPEQFISDLAIERYRATADLTKQIVAASANADNYEATIKQIVAKIDAGKKETLAEYVIHRKNIIALVEVARRFQDNGKRAPEDAIHDLVFRRFSDSASVDYFEHNLWLVDDALAFLPYVSSDRTLHGGRRGKGDKVTDLLFFDDSMILGDNDGTTLTIVEFKRPSRNDYAFGSEKDDPILQVINTLDKATAEGGISKTDGTYFSFANVVRRFAFVIADLTPTMIKVLHKHDFQNGWNPKVFVRYRERDAIFIQAFGYDTLIENAKKRNHAFFKVLLDE
ncbi:hypothetical protein LPJ38_09490 [Bradyrhizobium daqingense]|uniref:hypothetical protein n=1 Tax=Bradyrhizobium daqingense TaxID=993502 RepID=UPI001E654C7C|nr:hypothetical protein [Bradyrhizobium daqingense]UFS90935.1 hypothetical protein LPJ38_09490 [Bradyrhizobium daqingense]